jgi:hypothetical protein
MNRRDLLQLLGLCTAQTVVGCGSASRDNIDDMSCDPFVPDVGGSSGTAVVVDSTIGGAGTALQPYSVVGFRSPYGTTSPDYPNFLDDPARTNDRILVFMRNRQVNSVTWQESMVMQLNNESTLTTVASTRNARALELVCSVTRSAGANIIVAAGLVVNAGITNSIAGDEIYCIRSTTGQMRIDGGTLFNATDTAGFTVGSGAAAPPAAVQINHTFTIKDDKACTLGQTVQSFIMPGTALAEANIRIGFNGFATPVQLALKNSALGEAGLNVHLDTAISGAARGGIVIFRGTGAGQELAGFVVPGAAGHYASGTVAGDALVWSWDPGSAGRRCAFASGTGGGGPAVRGYFDNTGLFTVLNGYAHNGNLGFYGTAPIAKQVGVAVTAAAIHAALVNLGLIAA